jgi:hypothetical protein
VRLKISFLIMPVMAADTSSSLARAALAIYIARAVAAYLANKNLKTLIVTTDPAAHPQYIRTAGQQQADEIKGAAYAADRPEGALGIHRF